MALERISDTDIRIGGETTYIMPMQMLMTVASRVNKNWDRSAEIQNDKAEKRLVTAARPRQMRTLF